MVENLVHGKLKPPNSREMLLIPAGVFVKFRKNVAVLKIPEDGISSLKSRTGSKRVREIVLQTMVKTKDAARSQFHNALLALHEEVDHFGSKSKVVPINVPEHPMNVQTEYPMNFALDKLDSPPIPSAESALWSADTLPQFPVSTQPSSPNFTSPPSDSASESTQSLCLDPLCLRCGQSVAVNMQPAKVQTAKVQPPVYQL